MIEDYWIVNVGGATLCIDDDTKEELVRTLNRLNHEDRYALFRTTDVHTQAVNYIQYAAINYIVQSTPETRRLSEAHTKYLENETKEY